MQSKIATILFIESNNVSEDGTVSSSGKDYI
jgi:hypothetical protein